MSHFKKGIRQVLIIFSLFLILGFIASLYIQTHQYLGQWLVLLICMFILEIFSISNLLQIRKTLIQNFGILPRNSDDPFSLLYRKNQEKTWPKWNKVNLFYLLIMSFFLSLGFLSFIIKVDLLGIDKYFALFQSTPLIPCLIIFSMINIALFFVALIMLLYLEIFIKTLNETNQ